MTYSRGFTLIEVIVYIALLGVLMTGAVLTSYQIVQSTGNVNSKNNIQEEGNFVIGKIDWALSGASDVDTLVPNLLIVTRYDGIVAIKLTDIGGGVKVVQMAENGGAFASTTTSNVTVADLTFTPVGNPATGSPKGVTATLTMNGIQFSTTRYIRK